VEDTHFYNINWVLPIFIYDQASIFAVENERDLQLDMKAPMAEIISDRQIGGGD
jgi:hypothetical protein